MAGKEKEWSRTVGDSPTRYDSTQCHWTVRSKMAQNMTLMLVVKSDVSAAFPQFLMSKVGGAGAVSVCWGWEGGDASLGGCSLTQVLCEQLSVHFRQVTEDRQLEQPHFVLA